MGRHGENIHKRKCDGRWEGRCLYCDAASGKNKYHYVYGNSYEEVKRKKEAFLNKGKPAGRENTKAAQSPFSQAAEAWLLYVKKERKWSTYTKYIASYRKHIAPSLGQVALHAVTDTFVRQEILKEEWSDSVQKTVYCVLNGILAFAAEKYCLTLPKLRRPAIQKPVKPPEAFRADEQSALFFVLHSHTDAYKAAVFLALHTGMRLGELCALKWRDVDEVQKTLHVCRTVQRLPAERGLYKTLLTETPPKSVCSIRDIPLSPQMLHVLKKCCPAGDYVFGGKKPLEPRTMQYHFRKILAEAKIGKHNFHTLRHTFATNCVERGVDVKSLSEILGHSNVNITLNRYVHPTMDTKRKYMKDIENFYGQFRCQVSSLLTPP